MVKSIICINLLYLKGLQSSYIIAFSFLILLLLSLSNDGKIVYSQQVEQQNSNSPVNSICQLIQDNSLLTGLAGLDQALNICNNLNSIGANNALSELCSIIGGFNVINVDSYCNTDDLGQQPQVSNNGNEMLDNNRVNPEGNPQSNTNSQPSGSIIDRLIDMIFGFLNLGN